MWEEIKKFLTTEVISGIDWWMIITAIVAVLLIVIITCIAVACSKKKKRKLANTQAEKAVVDTANARSTADVIKIVDKTPIEKKAEPAPAVAEKPVEKKAEPAPVVAEKPVEKKAEPAPVVAAKPVEKKAEPAPAVAEKPVEKKAEPAPVVAAKPVEKKAEPAPVVAEKPVEKKAEPAVEKEVAAEVIAEKATAKPAPKKAEPAVEKKPVEKKATAEKKPAPKKAADKAVNAKATDKKPADKKATEEKVAPVKEASDNFKLMEVKDGNVVILSNDPEIETRGKFVISMSDNAARPYNFKLMASNGQLMFKSEGYKVKPKSTSILAFKKNAIKENFEIDNDKTDAWRFKLYTSTHTLIGVGETYKTKQACESSIESVISFAETAHYLEDQTLETKETK